MSALSQQVDGDHYKGGGIQPFELSMANDHDACTHAIQKYLTRHRKKAGVVDLRKAHHICAIRRDLCEKFGASHPRWNRIDIHDYIQSNALNEQEGRIVLMVESWHSVSDIDHEKTCAIIRKRIEELIKTEYPEEE